MKIYKGIEFQKKVDEELGSIKRKRKSGDKNSPIVLYSGNESTSYLQNKMDKLTCILTVLKTSKWK